MLWRPFLLAALCLGLWGLAAGEQVQAAASPPGEVHPISFNNPEVIGRGDAVQAALSADGRMVVYTMRVSTRNTGDETHSAQIYLYDQRVGSTQKIADLPGWDTDRWSDFQPSLSGNGRFIFYETSPASHNESGLEVIVPQPLVYDRFLGTVNPLWTGYSLDFQVPTSLTSSYDGRYLAFTGYPNGSVHTDALSLATVKIYDRLNAHTYSVGEPADQNGIRQPALGASPVLSGDGRTLIFLSRGTNTEPANPEGLSEIVVYNRVLDTFRRLPLQATLGREGLTPLAVESSNNAKVLVLLAEASEGAGRGAALYQLDPQLGTRARITTQGVPHTFQLSADGRWIAYTTSAAEGSSLDLHLLDLADGSDQLILQDIQSLEDISSDGNTIAFRRLVGGRSEVFCWQHHGTLAPTFTLAGRVVDATGYPLALVTIEDSRGNQTRTDGEGIFWLSGIKPGTALLQIFKEGFHFQPGSLNLSVTEDQDSLKIFYAHQETLEEARKDLGMPYSFERGASGPYHGFSAGYCTDLVLDAYTWGVDFNIQFALEQDFRAHPWHFYRWRDARNAHDMWRYFAYTGQLHSPEQPYQPGDIVFFDWSEDGEIDHVAIVSEVSSTNQPRKMLDASGAINANPSGLAAELPWESFHEHTVRGFARWSGKYQPVIVDTPADQVLQLALGGSGLVFWMVDPQGHILSPFSQGMPGIKMTDFRWEQTLSILNPSTHRIFYQVVIYNPGSQSRPYQFTAQVIQHGWVNDRFETKGSLKPGDSQRLSLTLDTTLGMLDVNQPTNPVGRIQDRVKDPQ